MTVMGTTMVVTPVKMMAISEIPSDIDYNNLAADRYVREDNGKVVVRYKTAKEKYMDKIIGQEMRKMVGTR